MSSTRPLLLASALLLASLRTALALQSPPLITKQPPPTEQLFQVAERKDENDRPFIIECEAKGEPIPKYFWFKNGKPFQWAVYDTRISQQPDRGTLVITSPKAEDIGSYQCQATNTHGTATSNSVFVRKSDLNSFKDQPPITMTANEGEPLELKCNPPEGYPNPTVHWMIQGDGGSLSSINSTRQTVGPFGNLYFSNVTLEDASNGFVYACSATSPFRNEYKVGNRVELSVIRTGSVSSKNKREPMKQYQSPKNIVALRGSKVEIWCIYSGTPLPTTQWQRSNGVLDLSDGRVKLSNFGKSLLITEALFEDEGEYECTSSNGVGTAKTSSFNLKLESVPYFTKEPEVRNAAEGETVVFECAADAVPKPDLYWIYNGMPLDKAPPNPRRTVTPNKITITNLQKSDTANYGCNATNNNGYVYKDVYVNVLELPPEIQEKPQDVAAVVGTDVKMVCKVFGAPHPEVKWLSVGDNRQELTGGRYQIGDDGTMTIKSVTFPDAGTYMCLATSKLGEDSANGTLVVKERTRITQGPEDYQVVAGNSATFRCTAAVDSTLDVSIGWLADGVPINFDIEPRFIQTSDNSLTITKTTELDSKVYTCVASTELDEARDDATLKVEDVPNAPTLKTVACREQVAEVGWQPNGDNRAPILGFTIQYNTSFAPDTWEEAANSPASSSSYTVSISPWANYTFRVIAKNRVGPSLPSGHSEVCTTPKALPEKNPKNVEGRGTKPDNLVIRWTPMSKIDHNAPKFRYLVRWKRNESNAEWNQKVIMDWRRGHLVIPNQPTYVPYKIRVDALNELGESVVESAEVIGYSGEDVPTAPPTNFRLEKIYDGKRALFSWSPVDNSTIRGEFLGYKIQTWTEKEGTDKKREMSFGPDVTQGLVTKFKPHARNKVQILSFNRMYEGPPSEVLTFDTPQGRPSAVDSLEAVPMGSSAFFLIWKKPRETNGVLTGYKVEYQKMNGLSLGPVLDRTPQITNPRTTRTKLAGLKPSTKYRITVRALTEAGEGPPYYIERTTKSPQTQQPDRPSLLWAHVRGEEGSENNLKITWLPNTEGRPGSHFFVQYRRAGEASWMSSPIEYYDDSILLRGLDPAQVYEIRTVSVDGLFNAYSDVEEVETYAPDGPYIQATQSVHTSGWFIAMMLAVALLLLILVLVCIVRRNRGGKYDVQDRENAHGRGDLYPEDGFQEYQQPLDAKLPPGSRGSLGSDVKHPHESDTDSMAEYGDDPAGRFTEDGSFIGQYGAQKRKGSPPTGAAYV
ncbi:neuroglian-like isoform X3 [Pollicipes pollicipes]|uniref:neuroglian-like isoform X3 n=1 Tax=Pollicipes pollicipes TaxID=41117 RepID=UPI0018855AC4|nr:neuroglian-like isoform X3 [Pollicipes pollicipes]